MDQNYDFLLEKAKSFHGDACAGIALGTRLTMAGMKALGLDPMTHNRDLIVFVEIDRCMTDAVQAITGCSLGHRTLKHLNYGKFAATFYDMNNKRAVRVASKDVALPDEDPLQAIKRATDEDLMQIQEVSIEVDSNDLPGRPKNKQKCSLCDESILDNKGIEIDGKILCQPCSSSTYYAKK